MNKKRLSVVMAGAMLATSVAPVLAAETTVTTSEYTVGQKELLKKYLNNKLESKKFTTNTVLNDYVDGNSQEKSVEYLGATVAEKLHDANDGDDIYKQSVYTIKIGDTVLDSTNTIEKTINDSSKFKAGVKIEISEKENTTFLGQVIPAKEAPKALELDSTKKYTTAELTPGTASGQFGYDSSGAGTDGLGKQLKDGSIYISDATCTEADKATIKLTTLKDINNPASNVELTIKKDDVKYDLNLPLDSEGKLLDAGSTDTDDLQKCNDFVRETKWTAAYATSAEPVKVETITIKEDAPTEEVVTYKASDLYDGTLLTEIGTELLNDHKNSVEVKGSLQKVTVNPVQTVNGIGTFTIEYRSKSGILVKTVKVSSANKKEIDTVYNLIYNKEYNVGIVAGQNRYSTAVAVAKEAGVKKLVKPTGSNTVAGEVSNVILVNGDSLVDGLAAAPLSKHLSTVSKNIVAAPLLLTKTDSLPKETKDFLKELIENTAKNDLKDIKINLVGGNAVLSDSLVKELKDMGFSVVRYGGDDREETSIKVANALTGATTSYIVGANSEADAMSISAEAFNSKTPIIVSSVHGLTSDAIEFLGNQNGNATIIGGEKAISAEEEAKVREAKEANKKDVFRIAGANRTETNAAILKKFYVDNSGTLVGKKVTLVKNGINDKKELVDALSAANLGGPIVLVNDKLEDSQKDVLLKSTSADNTSKLLQVGLGLDDSIIKSVSKILGITNK
ncbi:cell wall-binding repeat-containing protein [Peptacetobacter hiranonis]|uniref:cell wall-binding repeat-containing protein n=1 Tax=Peptacetobacter hiranonis TaxID=89152 RepID=UPI0022E6AE9D|nr:cell wall-binding repeat-containing protein [Peptacetobacter hiranonis]